MERHFRGATPRQMCEPLLEKLRDSEGPLESTGVLCTNRQQALIHILRDKVVLLAIVVEEEPPLAVFELLDRVYQVLSRYLGEVSDDTLRQNFSTVYLLLDEMIDSGLPFTTDRNSLEAIIAPSTAISKVVQAVSGNSSQVLSDVPPETKSQVWWRRQNVVYASNEIYIDTVESIDCIVDANGQMVSGGINGDIHVSSKLSGMPEILLTLRNQTLLQNASFHPCVRLHRLERDRALSFVPPDGDFTLASYWIPDMTLSLPFHFSTSVNFHAEHGKVQISASPKIQVAMQNKQMLIDKFTVNVRLPSCVSSATTSCQGGTIQFNNDTKVIAWQIGQLVRQENKAEATVTYATNPKDNTAIRPTEEKCTAQLAFDIKGWVISGIKLDSCIVSGVPYTPYKASRYTTTAGRMDFRIA